MHRGIHVDLSLSYFVQYIISGASFIIDIYHMAGVIKKINLTLLV